MIWPALAAAAPTLLKAGGSLLSAFGGGLFGGGSAAKAERRQAELQSLIQGTSFSPINVSMPGGGGITFGGSGGYSGGGFSGGGGGFAGNVQDPRTGRWLMREGPDGMRILGQGKHSRAFQTDIGNIGLNLGDLEGTRAGLAGFTGMGVQDLLSGTGFEGFQQAGGGISESGLGQMLQSFGGLDALSALTGGQLGGAVNDLNMFRQNLQNPLQAGILSSINDASVTGQQASQNALNLLREQAQPFEQRAFQDLQQNLFSTGRSGTTGGGIQMEAFARGLGQADTQRQIQAMQEGRNATQMALNQATSLGGLQENLQTGALNRFNSLTDFANQLSNQRFNRGMDLGQFGVTMAGAGDALRSGQLGNIQTALQGLTGLTNISTVPADLALRFMNAQSGARQGQQTSGSAAAMPGAARADLLTSLGGAISNNAGGIARGIGSIFNLFRGQ